MIRSKQDLRMYMSMDRAAYGKPENPSLRDRIRNVFFPDHKLEYMKCLRKLEYYTNTGNLLRFWYTKKLGRLKLKTGIHLEPNCAGPGLHITHGHIVINNEARLGENCKIMQYVTLGGEGRYDRNGAPKVGNRVFIGAGAKLIGNIQIADDVVIGANAVVVKDVLEPGITVGGIPAKKISNGDSYPYLNRK